MSINVGIGFSPETNQDRWGNPQTSPFGNTVRAGFNPYGGADYFAYQPYLPAQNNFYGQQMVGVQPAEFLYGDYRGYGGIMPLGLQGVSPERYPYQLPYPFNRYA